METFFHLSLALLSPGSIIENGNFGRMLNRYLPNGRFDLALLYREEVFELVRRRDYSDKPSRFKSIFLLKNMKEALQYMEYNAPDHNMYEVEIVDTSKPLHEGPWTPVFPFGGALRKYASDFASVYWQGKILPVKLERGLVFPREVIVESPVKVLRRVSLQ